MMAAAGFTCAAFWSTKFTDWGRWLATQFNNPFHLWQLWDAGVRQQRRALVRHNAIIGEKLARMRKQPPAAHTIAGKPGAGGHHGG
jgi:hypothetical protein